MTTMTTTTPGWPSPRPISLAALALAGGAGLSPIGCGDPEDEDHNLFDRVEIETRGLASELIAVWTADDGWEDADGEAIDTLPTPVDDEAEGLLPFREDGDRASLTVRMLGSDGEEIDADTVERDDETGERVCTEFSARYDVDLDDPEAGTDVLAWPPEAHPDAPEGSAQFVHLEEEDEYAGIFHCDHVHIYPKSEGEAEIRFVLWHIDHSDDFTDTIGVEVAPAE